MWHPRNHVDEAFEWAALALDIVLFFVKLAVGIILRSTAFVADALRTVCGIINTYAAHMLTTIKTYIIVSRATALWSSKAQYRRASNDFTYGVS